MHKKIDTLILDLDNTIFDWFHIWYGSFYPIYEEILKRKPDSEDCVNDAIRRVHQKARTSEYTFLLEDLVSSGFLVSQGDIRDDFSDPLEAARKARDERIKLYPTVLRSLWAIKSQGVKIAAYTESMGFYSAYRLKRLGLDGVIDVMFCPEDHENPSCVSIAKLRSRPDDNYELQVTSVEHTPAGELKPNVKILREIVSRLNADPERCAYVGDSIFKDVAMARGAGIYDVWAKYGESQRRPEYELLQKISHWTESDVQREREITKNGADFVPSATLRECFSEIFEYCDFVKFSPKASQGPAQYAQIDIDKINLEIWKKVIDVQQHFNDIELRIRNFAITIIGALIAAIGVLTQKDTTTLLFGYRFPTSLSLVAAALLVWTAFYLMDKFWYHILLKGSVNHNIEVARLLKDRFPAIDLGSTISKESQSVKVFGKTMNSSQRLAWFYRIGYAMLIVVGVAIFFSGQAVSPVADTKPVETSSTSKP